VLTGSAQQEHDMARLVQGTIVEVVADICDDADKTVRAGTRGTVTSIEEHTSGTDIVVFTTIEDKPRTVTAWSDDVRRAD
jgi:hypothetical protein